MNLFYILLLQRIVEKSSQKNLKVTINTLPNKLGHPESLKKKKNSSANVHTVFAESTLQVILPKVLHFK